MSLSRRDFTLLGLVGAFGLAASPALAGAPAKKQKLPLRAVLSGRRADGVLYVDLTLKNVGKAQDVLVRVGSKPAPTLEAWLDEVELTAKSWDQDPDEMRTRAGPRPVYQPIAVAGQLRIGTYRFALPEGLPDEEAITLQVTTTVNAGAEYVTLAQVSLTIDGTPGDA